MLNEEEIFQDLKKKWIELKGKCSKKDEILLQQLAWGVVLGARNRTFPNGMCKG